MSDGHCGGPWRRHEVGRRAARRPDAYDRLRVAACFLSLPLVLACADTVQPELPALDVQIIAPAAEDSLYAPDTALFVGEATANDLGLLPDDSLWWTDNGLAMGQGRVVRHQIAVGLHVYRLHARYNQREDSATLVTDAVSGIGRILWTVPLQGAEWDGVAMSPEGTLYALDGNDEAVAISRDGEVLWRTSLPVFVLGSIPAIGPDGTIHVGHWSRGGVVALQPDGSLKWVADVTTWAPPDNGPYHVHGGVAVGPDGSVYFTTEERDSPMYALGADGTLKWRVSTSGAGSTANMKLLTYTTLVGDSLAVSFQRRDSLIAVSIGAGARRWTAALGNPSCPWCQHTMAVGQDGSIFAARGDSMAAFSPDGSTLWRRQAPAFAAGGSPTLDDARLYLAGRNGSVRVLSRTGEPLDSFGPNPDALQGAVALAAKGVVYVAGLDTLFSYDATGALRFATEIRHEPDWWHAQGGPVVSPDGTLYFRSSSLGVVAIRDTVGPATSAPWPLFQGGPMRQGRGQ